MKKLFLIILSVSALTIATNAQNTANCKQTCEVTKIVEEGPFLGVQVQNGPCNHSAQIIKVFAATAAEKTGFQLGDVIVQVDETTVTNNYHLVSIIGTHKPGDKVLITYVRNGVTASAKVRIGAKTTKFVTEKVCCDEVKNNLVSTDGLLLYPNPSTDKVSIKTKEAIEGDVTISVYSIEGKEVYFDTKVNTGQLNTTIDLTSFTAGEYVVRISGTNTNYTDKLFVSK